MKAARFGWVGAMLALALGLAMGTAHAQAKPTPEKTREEVSYLLAEIEKSGCSFERNGRTHDSATARSHMERKYKEVLKRKPDASTEDFIEAAASRSSITGRPYLVKCGDVAVQSGEWMRQKLASRKTP